MSDKQTMVGELISKLKQERDELKLKLHLAEMEARDEYERISRRVDDLADQYAPLQDAVEESADNVFEALGLVADELQLAFGRVRKAIEKLDDKHSQKR